MEKNIYMSISVDIYIYTYRKTYISRSIEIDIYTQIYILKKLVLSQYKRRKTYVNQENILCLNR